MADIFEELGITQTGEPGEEDIFGELGIGRDVTGRPTGKPEKSREEFIQEFIAQRQLESPQGATLGEAAKGVATVGGPQAVSSIAAAGEFMIRMMQKTVGQARAFAGTEADDATFLADKALQSAGEFFSKENNIYMHIAQMNAEELHPSLFRRFSEDKTAALDPAWLMFNVGNVAYQFLPVILSAAAGGATGIPALGFVAPFLVGGGLEAGNVYKDERAKGKSEDQALRNASAAYVAVGLLEAISAHKIVSGFGGKGLARRFIGGGLIEAGTEAAEELAIGYITGDKFDESLKNAIDVLPATFLLGLATAGIFGGGQSPNPIGTNIKTLKDMNLDKTQVLELSLLEKKLNNGQVTPEQANEAVQSLLGDIDAGKYPKAKEKLVNAAAKGTMRLGDVIYQNLILNEDTIKSAQESAQAFEAPRKVAETKEAVAKITEPTGKVAEESAQVFEEGGTTPERVARALDQPTEIKILEGRGIVDEPAQIKAIVKDAIEQPLQTAQIFEKRGDEESANQLKDIANNKARIIREVGGETVEADVAKALKGEKATIDTIATTPEMKTAVHEALNKGMTTSMIDSFVTRLGKDEFLRAYGGATVADSKTTVDKSIDTVVRDKSEGTDRLRAKDQIARVDELRLKAAKLGMPKEEFNDLLGSGIKAVETEVNSLEELSKGVEDTEAENIKELTTEVDKILKNQGGEMLYGSLVGKLQDKGFPISKNSLDNVLLDQGYDLEIESGKGVISVILPPNRQARPVDTVFNDEAATESDATRDISSTGVQISDTRDNMLHEFFKLKGIADPSNKLNGLSETARDLMYEDLKTDKLSIKYNEVLEAVGNQIEPEIVEGGVHPKTKEELYNENYEETTEDIVDEMDKWMGLLGEEGSADFNAKLKGFTKDKPTIETPPIIEALTAHAEASRTKGKVSFQEWANFILKQNYADIAKPFLRFAWQTAEANIKQNRRSDLIRQRLETLGKPEGKAILNITLDKKGKIKKTKNSIYTTNAELAEMINLKEDMPSSILDVITPREFMFERMDNVNDIAMFGDIFYDFTKRETSARRESNAILDRMKELTKGLNPVRLGTYAAIRNVPELRSVLEQIDGIDTSVMENVTPREKEAYEASRQFYDQMWIELNQAREEMGVEPLPYNVDYFTFIRLDEYISKSGSNMIEASQSMIAKALAAISPNLLEPHHDAKTIKFPFEKRQKSIKPVDLNFNRVFELYTNRAKKYQHLGPLVARLREMTGKFHVGLDKRGGPVTFKMSDTAPVASEFLNSWADVIIGTRKRSELIPQQVSDVYEAAVSLVTRNVATYTLGLAFRSFIIQPTANALTASWIGPKWVVEGHKQLLDPKMRKFAVDNSNHLISRSADVQLDEMANVLVTSGVMEFHRKMSEKAFIPLQWLDIQSATAGWLGSYSKFKTVDGLSHEDAARAADRVIRKTHAAAGRGYRSPIQLTTTGRLVTLFQTFAIGEFAYVVNEVMTRTRMTDPATGRTIVPEAQAREQAKRVIKLLLVAGLVNALYEDGMGLNSPMPSPSRAFLKRMNEGDSMTEALIEIPKEFIAQVPVIGGGPAFGSSIAGAGVQHLTDVLTHFSNKTGPKKSGLELIAKTLGVPGGAQAKKSIKALNDGGSPWDIFAGAYKKDREHLINYILYMALSDKEITPQERKATTEELPPEGDIFKELGISE